MTNITKMIVESLQTEAYNAENFTATQIIKGKTVVCSGGMAHMRGHMIARCVRFTWTIDGQRSSKAEVVSLIDSKAAPAEAKSMVPTYGRIAEDYALWLEYAQDYLPMTENEFNALSKTDKLALIGFRGGLK